MPLQNIPNSFSNTDEHARILALLDFERRTIYAGSPAVTDLGVIKEVSADGKSCEIVYSCCSEDELDGVIGRQVALAREAGQELEWKLYGHDRPAHLAERLAAAGFKPGDREAFLVLRMSGDALARFGPPQGDIRRVTSQDGLRDYQTVFEEVSGCDCRRHIDRYEATLANDPETLSIYVAYVDGEPAACGRVYFLEGSQFAALYGGQTRARYRKRGLFTQVVAARVREALVRGFPIVCVDALPTSEPILRKRGFHSITYTQPFLFDGRG